MDRAHFPTFLANSFANRFAINAPGKKNFSLKDTHFGKLPLNEDVTKAIRGSDSSQGLESVLALPLGSSGT